MERINVEIVGRSLVGAVMLAQAAALGVFTVGEMVGDHNRRPDSLVFQEAIHRLRPPEDAAAPFSNFEIVNGFVLNAIAMGGLARAGLDILRSAQELEAGRNTAA